MAADAFDILGLTPSFDLDPAAIQRAYLARAAAAHPDRSVGMQLGATTEAGPSAAALNAARAVLDDPEQRALVLLARLGGTAKDADRSLPDGFLEKMMQMREEMESGAVSEAFVERVEAMRDAHVRRVSELFGKAQGGPADASDLRMIRRELNAWRYIERMIEQMDGGGDEVGR